MDYFSETGNPCLGLGFSTGFTVISRRLCSGSLRSRWDTGREGVPSLPPNSTPTEGAAAPVTDHFPLPVIRKLSLHAGLGQRGTVTVLVAMSGSSSAKFSGKIGCLFFFLTSPVDPIGWGCLSGTKPWFNNRHTATALHAFHSEAPKHLANSAPVLFLPHHHWSILLHSHRPRRCHLFHLFWNRSTQFIHQQCQVQSSPSINVHGIELFGLARDVGTVKPYSFWVWRKFFKRPWLLNI